VRVDASANACAYARKLLASDRIPPPHPTSSTSRPASTRLGLGADTPAAAACSNFSRMKRIRCAFILCRRANSPRSSHQSAERREKWAISASLTVEKWCLLGWASGCGMEGADADVLAWTR
jgi:hypothetical protein